jgi:toxin YoeB
MRTIAFTSEAFKEYNEWFFNVPQVIDRIKILIRDIERDAFKGLGKPEPLKGNYSGYWSRRIDNEHRLVYKITEIQILIIKCKGHY